MGSSDKVSSVDFHDGLFKKWAVTRNVVPTAATVAICQSLLGDDVSLSGGCVESKRDGGFILEVVGPWNLFDR